MLSLIESVYFSSFSLPVVAVRAKRILDNAVEIIYDCCKVLTL